MRVCALPGKTYYYNKKTKQKQWRKPTADDHTEEAQAAQKLQALMRGKKARANIGSLVGNWEKRKHPKTGRPFFYNVVTMKSQWTKPTAEDEKQEAEAAAKLQALMRGKNARKKRKKGAADALAKVAMTDILADRMAGERHSWVERKDKKSGRCRRTSAPMRLSSHPAAPYNCTHDGLTPRPLAAPM